MAMIQPESKYDLRRVPLGAFIDINPRTEINPQHLVDQYYQWAGRGWISREYGVRPLRGNNDLIWLEIEHDEEWVIALWRKAEANISFDISSPPRLLVVGDTEYYYQEKGMGIVTHVTQTGSDHKGEVLYFDYANSSGDSLLCVEVFPDSDPEVFLGESISHLNVTAYGNQPAEGEASERPPSSMLIGLVVYVCGILVLIGLFLFLFQLFT